MRRLVALAAIGALVVGGAAGAAASGDRHKPRAEHIPASLHRAHVNIETAKGYSRRGNTVRGRQARRLIDDFNALKLAPRSARPCPLDTGRREIVAFTFHGNVVDAASGFCGYVAVVRDGKALPTLNDSKAYEHDIQHDLAPAIARPKAEHVPASLRRVRLVSDSVTQPATPTKTRVVTGGKAAALVREFNHLVVEPAGTIHCDVVGGPQTVVTFKTRHHTWIARQSACTNVQVTRDGHPLPTLLESAAWNRSLGNDLGQ